MKWKWSTIQRIIREKYKGTKTKEVRNTKRGNKFNWTHSTQIGMHKTKSKLWSQKQAKGIQDNQAKKHQMDMPKMV